MINLDTNEMLHIPDVMSGGMSGNEENNTHNAPFGNYDILERVDTHPGFDLFHRLEPIDSKYGNDIADFPDNKNGEQGTLRLHKKGNGVTYGCVSIPEEYESAVLNMFESTSKSKVSVNTKYRNPFKKFFKPTEDLTKYGTLKIIILPSDLSKRMEE